VIICKTPLRVSAIGGGSDLEDFYLKYGGAVLSTAIDKSVYVILKERFDDRIYVNWSKKEIVDRVEDIEHELVRCAMQITGVDKGIEITMLSDIPAEGTGLGSSSSFTVALLHALYTYQNVLVTAEKLASEACHIEIEMLKKPIGRQDQFASAFGNLNLIAFNKEIKVFPIKANKKKLNDNLLIFYTGVTRKSSDILTDQKLNIDNRIEVLSQMRDLAILGKVYLEHDQYDDFGKLLNQNWELKKQLSERISNSQIDDIYETALKAGAIGAKILGAGGGGFMLFYVRKDKQDDVRNALHGLKELEFKLQNDGSKIIFNYR
jgi:D-glycero-alpha-D-manno-heptose-7-phosphate kinase